MSRYTDQRVLVTGGASFIGSHLVEALVADGALVRVADDLSSGRMENLASVESQIDFRLGDLKHLTFAEEVSDGCAVVFHLAADHGGRAYIATHPASCATNMALDNLVFEAGVRAGVEQIVYASSACVYPTHVQQTKTPLREDMVSFAERGGAFADEEYGWAKLMGELSLNAFHRQFGIQAASARIFTAYGPRENESHALIALIARAFVQQSPYEIWGDGEQCRNFTYVDDVVRGILLAGEHVQDGSAVNVGTPDFVSLNEAAQAVFSAIGWSPPDGMKYSPDKPVGVLYRAADCTKAGELLGWEPSLTLEEGVQRTVDWYVGSRDRNEVAAKLEQLLYERSV